MDLTFSEQETAFRDELRDWLASNQPDPEPTEARRGRRTTPGGATGSARLYDAGWAAPAWPTEYGGRGASLTESAIYFEELGRARVPMAGERARPAAGRPDADGVGHRRAEGALPAADPLGRGDLVPGLLRARRRLGSRVAEDEGGQGRRRVGRHRPEGVDERRAVLQVVHARRAHATRRSPSTRA